MKIALLATLAVAASAGECYVQFHGNGDELTCDVKNPQWELKDGARYHARKGPNWNDPTPNFGTAQQCFNRANDKFNYCKLNLELETKITVTAEFLDYPKCQPHAGSVHAMCDGKSVKRWGIGPEGEKQAVKNCHYASHYQKKFGTCPPKTYTAGHHHKAGQCWIQRHGAKQCPKCDEPGVNCVNNNMDKANWHDRSVTDPKSCMAKAKGIYDWCKTGTIKATGKGTPEPAISAHWYDGSGTMASDTTYHTRSGCHITLDTCPKRPNHPNCNGKFPCTFKEQWSKWDVANDNEGACLQRARHQLHYCGIDTSEYRMYDEGELDDMGVAQKNCPMKCHREQDPTFGTLIVVTHKPNEHALHRCALIDDFDGNGKKTGSSCKCFCLEEDDEASEEEKEDPMEDKGEQNCGTAHKRPCKEQWQANNGCSKDTSIAKPFNDNSCWPCGGNNQLACQFKFKDNQGCGPDDTLAKGGDADREHPIGKHHGYNEVNPNPHPAGKCWICGGDNQPRCDNKYGNNNGCKAGHSGTHHANKCWSCTRGNVQC